jgi:heme/copper-type cytochrome/quinol oxidase subunit 4
MTEKDSLPPMVWRTILIVALGINAALGFGYRVYRLSKGGPMADVWGQAILAVLLTVDATLIAAGHGWARWAALAYGLLFALVVLPVWILGVLIPMRPERSDYAFTAIYACSLLVVVVAAIAM